jgi:GNAT superfamily N-acetyltransferase
MAEISYVKTEEEIAQVRAMLREYRAELPVDFCFLDFDREVQGLPGDYAEPTGTLLLATVSGQPAGCVALRPFRDIQGACEMKRLYVRHSFRGYKLGALLAQRIIQEARDRGYHIMRLDTYVASMQSAISLYRRLGFSEVMPTNPVPELLYMELDLTAQALPG